jgi:anti-anti-sigma regulatory factor
VHLRLVGAFDRGAHRELHRTLRQALNRARAVKVIIDVSRVDVIDGRCVDALLFGYTWALRGGHGYEVADARGAVRRALEVAGLCARQYDAEALYPPVWFDAVELWERVMPRQSR